MKPATTITGMLAAVWLAGTSAVSLAQSSDDQTLPLDDAEIERIMETGRLFDLEPAWPALEPIKRFSSSATPPPPGTKTPATGADETQSAIARGLKAGLPLNVEPSALPAEVKRNIAITDTFKGGVRAGFDAPMGEDMRPKTASLETQITLGGLGPSISWGWFTGIDMAVQADAANAVAAGPQLKMGGDKLALTLSPKLAHGFGAQSGSDVAVAYSAGLKGELTKGVALGIEAFGTTSNIAPIPGMALQTQRNSQALYVGLGLAPLPIGDASKFSLEVGALAGMSEATPDLTGRIKAAITW